MSANCWDKNWSLCFNQPAIHHLRLFPLCFDPGLCILPLVFFPCFLISASSVSSLLVSSLWHQLCLPVASSLPSPSLFSSLWHHLCLFPLCFHPCGIIFAFSLVVLHPCFPISASSVSSFFVLTLAFASSLLFSFPVYSSLPPQSPPLFNPCGIIFASSLFVFIPVASSLHMDWY